LASSIDPSKMEMDGIGKASGNKIDVSVKGDVVVITTTMRKEYFEKVVDFLLDLKKQLRQEGT
jgi:hypothetical protein